MERRVTDRVSAVVPTRDRPDLLQRALRSILSQTHPPFEVIVVDDASEKPAKEVVAALREPSVRCVRHETRRGASAARNTGVREARGDLLAFLDDDDEWAPTKVGRLLAALSPCGPEVAVVYGAHEVVAPSGEVVNIQRPIEGPIDQREFLRTTSFMTSVPLVRRECIEAVGGFDETLPGGQDRDLWIRMSARFEFRSVPDVVARHYVHGEQITTDLAKKIESKVRLIAKHRTAYEEHPLVLAQQLERLGMLYILQGDFERGRRALSESISVRPHRRARGHLERSLADPEEHRAWALENWVRTIEGVRLYY